MCDTASHWATKPLTADELPSANAPRAGGGIVAPDTKDLNPTWEWEVSMAVKQVRSIVAAASDGNVLHCGRCHCGLVRFEFDAPANVTAWDCNCSNCRMRRNVHVVVPEKALRILQGGAAALAEYRYGSGTARHLFCSRCGITPFYKPRSNPDGWGVTLQCIDPGTIASVEVRHFDGLHWDEFISAEGAAIKAFSKKERTSPPPTDVGASSPPPMTAQAASPPPGTVVEVVLAALDENQFLVLPASLASGVLVQTHGGAVGAVIFVGWLLGIVAAMLVRAD